MNVMPISQQGETKTSLGMYDGLWKGHAGDSSWSQNPSQG